MAKGDLMTATESPTPTIVIDIDDIGELGDVDDALADFYDRQMASAAEVTGVGELAIRTWIESELVTDHGFRSQVQQGPGDDPDAVPRVLENAHLLRAESRRGTSWYEIAHDRMVAPALASNDRWRQERLSTLQRAAIDWDAAERSDALLARGDVLDEIEGWAAANAHELSDDDTEFLEASRAERHAARAAVRRQRRDRLVAVVASGLAGVAVVAMVVAVRQKSNAQAAEATAGLALAGAESAYAEADEAWDVAVMALDESDLLYEETLALYDETDALYDELQSKVELNDLLQTTVADLVERVAELEGGSGAATALFESAACGSSSIQSGNSDTPTVVTFINDSTEVRDVFWIDYSGVEIYYATLFPGDAYDQGTFVTHAWMVADDFGTCLGIYEAPGGLSTVTMN